MTRDFMFLLATGDAGAVADADAAAGCDALLGRTRAAMQASAAAAGRPAVFETIAHGDVRGLVARAALRRAAPDALAWRADAAPGQPGLAIELDASGRALTVDNARFSGRTLYALAPQQATVAGRGVFVLSSRLDWLAGCVPGAALAPDALSELLLYRFGCGEASMFEGIARITAGTRVRVSAREGTCALEPLPPFAFAPEAVSDVGAGLVEYTRRLRVALGEAIADGIRSPHAAVLLSGGVDSSVIAALAREQRPGIRCYTIAFDAPASREEVRRARHVADRLGLPLQVVTFDEGRLAADFQHLIDALQEPPRNPNNLALVQLYRAMAGDGVDAALNGDGPEMLLGLHDARRVDQFQAKARWRAVLPVWLRARLAGYAHGRGEGGARLARLLTAAPEEFVSAMSEIHYRPGVAAAIADDPARFRAEWLARYFGDAPSHSVSAGARTRAGFDGARSRAGFDDAHHAFEIDTTLMSSMRRHTRLAECAGIVAVTPFVHARMLAFAAALPRPLRYVGRARPTLKALCDELVGPEVCTWPKLGFETPWQRWLECLPAAGLAEPGWPAGFAAAAEREADAEARWLLACAAACQRRAAAQREVQADEGGIE